jgi:hypothetical protein
MLLIECFLKVVERGEDATNVTGAIQEVTETVRDISMSANDTQGKWTEDTRKWGLPNHSFQSTTCGAGDAATSVASSFGSSFGI